MRIVTASILIVAVAACAPPPNQSPKAQSVAKRIHDWTMNIYKSYDLQSRSKALAICVKWPEAADGDILVMDAGGSYTTDQSGGNVAGGELMRSAMMQCEGRKARRRLDCTCQALDVSGSVKLDVPESLPRDDHPISTRRSSGSSGAGKGSDDKSGS